MGRCDSCRYYVTVKGQTASRRLCVAGVKAYRSGSRVLNDTVDVMELILVLGKEKLEAMIGRGGENKMACGEFEKGRT
ncbi:hypothetical protein [Desulforamulus aeronauticus]|uniref:Uncharacterized protein n=1 Tax=Desulforamulus aeronauticus DSM 10349 TaxID=1121421 RepID=A0A1M6VBS8_9FIRM|nr:hypothetical protein [Desulforamulus aeronauticus]SHK78963.1 hypothetical protein SAMN02745123_03122 [Desulforamulus aeronauticus DSM 10349]